MRPREQTPPLTRVDAVTAAFAALVPLGVYIASLPSSPSSWDTAEMQTAPYVLGIAHPPGFPLLILAGWVFSHVVAVGTVAWRMNLFSACCTAATCALLCLTARMLGALRLAALFASLIYGFGDYVWHKTLGPDPHVAAMLCTSLALFFLARYIQREEPRTIWYAAAAIGFGMAAHPNALWTIPALLFALATARKRSLRTALTCIPCLAAPLSLYLYMPIRSAVIEAQGLDPMAALTMTPANRFLSLVWDTNKTRTIEGFQDQLFASGSGAGSTLAAIFNVTSYPSYVAYWWSTALPEFGWLALLLALLGAVALARRNLRAAVMLVLAGFSTVPFAVAYSSNEADVERYILASFGVAAVFMAFAPDIVPSGLKRVPVAALLTLLLFVAAGESAYLNRFELGWRLDRGSQWVTDDVAAETPPGAVVITAWFDATSLAYGEDVEGVLDHRIIVYYGPLSFLDEIPTWRRTHRIYVFADSVILPEIAKLPPHWATLRPGLPPSEVNPLNPPSPPIYELCADPAVCRPATK